MFLLARFYRILIWFSECSPHAFGEIQIPYRLELLLPDRVSLGCWHFSWLPVRIFLPDWYFTLSVQCFGLHFARSQFVAQFPLAGCSLHGRSVVAQPIFSYEAESGCRGASRMRTTRYQAADRWICSSKSLPPLLIFFSRSSICLGCYCHES
jgi:hypothetical protein